MGSRIATGVAAGLATALVLAVGAHAATPRAGRVYVGTDDDGLAARGSASAGGGLGAPAGSTLDQIALAGWNFVKIDDGDAAVTYDGPQPWTTRALPAAINGTVHQARRKGSTATVAVQGSRATIYYVAVRGGAVVDVYLDSFDPADLTVNRIGVMRQSRAYRRQAWALHLADLPTDPGHQLLLRQRSRGRMILDAVVFQDAAVESPVGGLADFTLDPLNPDDTFPYWRPPADPYLVNRGLWSTWPDLTAYSWRRGDTATFSFTGDAFSLYMYVNRRRRSLGRIRVSIDGAPAFQYPVISQRAGRRGYYWYWWSGLPTGPHTVTVTHHRGKSVNLRGFYAFDLSLP